ncbi:MAG: hypothetical protein IPI70_15855 [Nitrospira sp.]|nr:hypothetical protein [Nitrospira sp.]
MTMIHGAIPTAVALTAVLSISCASPPPSQEKLGKSLTAMKAAQIAAADGRRNDRSGLDGRAAQMVMRGYLGTYDRSQDGGAAAPPQTPPGLKETINAAMPSTSDEAHP